MGWGKRCAFVFILLCLTDCQCLVFFKNLLSNLTCFKSICFIATETAQQLKKTAGVPFHAKGRGLVKKIDTTSKLTKKKKKKKESY